MENRELGHKDRMEFPINLPTDKEVERLAPVAKSFAFLNGLLFLEKDGATNHLPLTLLPSPFPRKAFQCMSEVQGHVSLLYHRAACDHEFLVKTFEGKIELDDYLGKLWEIYMNVRLDMAQKNFLGLIRTDYMLQSEGDDPFKTQPKQIEINLMAAGLGSLSQKLVQPHRLLLKMSRLKSEEEAEETVPDNYSAVCVVRGILAAHKLYHNDDAGVLFVVADFERNIFDQRALEEAIYKQKPSVHVLRRSFSQLRDGMELRGSQRRLFVDGKEIAVIYFRHGYSPAHFQESWMWEVKLTMERSAAIKNPSIQHMLVNTKQVQQALSKREAVERFIKDPAAVDMLMSVVVGQFDPRDPNHFEEALAHPERFVLKPSREGGGNNYFGEGLKKRLLELQGSPMLGAYVLMELIRSPTFYNYALLPGESVIKWKMVTELGVFGIILGNAEEIHANFGCGHLMRSKKAENDEGGVMSGNSCVDSPLLV